jgi:16S rRNA G527 N7-methylase RsmG
LNRNFYEKKGKEATICDNEMKDFLQRRASLRKAIDEKKHTEIESVKVPRQYTNIPSRAFSTISHLSSKSLPKVSSQRLIGDCQDYLRKRERIKNKNEF